MNQYAKNILAVNKQLTLKALRFLNLDVLEKYPQKPDAIIVIGMGGSGTVSNILQNLADEFKIPVPVIIWKDYGLPKTIFKNPLFVFISFSGNTEETISGFIKAKNSKQKCIVAGGGKLLELGQKLKIPIATFKQDTLAPRQANGLMLYGALILIKTVFPEIVVENLDKKINPESFQNLGKEIADKLDKKIVLIYSTSNNSHLAYSWKIKLNETAKSLAFWHTLPEMSHNEIVGFESRPQNLTTLFLIDPADKKENKKRGLIVSRLLEKYNISSLTIELKGATRLEKTVNSLVLAEWVSYYLAKKRNVDPQKTQIIEEIKKRMK